MNAITTYFQEALTELHQVRWPTRQQAVRLSAIVLGFTLISALLFGAIDFLLQKIVYLILSAAY